MATIKVTEPIPNPYTCANCGQENLSLDHDDASCPGYDAQLFIPMVLKPDRSGRGYDVVEPEPVREIELSAEQRLKLSQLLARLRKAGRRGRPLKGSTSRNLELFLFFRGLGCTREQAADQVAKATNYAENHDVKYYDKLPKAKTRS